MRADEVCIRCDFGDEIGDPRAVGHLPVQCSSDSRLHLCWIPLFSFQLRFLPFALKKQRHRRPLPWRLWYRFVCDSFLHSHLGEVLQPFYPLYFLPSRSSPQNPALPAGLEKPKKPKKPKDGEDAPDTSGGGSSVLAKPKNVKIFEVCYCSYSLMHERTRCTDNSLHARNHHSDRRSRSKS
jgi:hypothetical protein